MQGSHQEKGADGARMGAGLLETEPRQERSHQWGKTLTWLAKKCPMILTMTSSFSSGVWSRGTMTSALVKFCSSFTCSRGQNPRFWGGRPPVGPAPKPPRPHVPFCHLCLSRGRLRRKAP